MEFGWQSKEADCTGIISSATVSAFGHLALNNRDSRSFSIRSGRPLVRERHVMRQGVVDCQVAIVDRGAANFTAIIIQDQSPWDYSIVLFLALCGGTRTRKGGPREPNCGTIGSKNWQKESPAGPWVFRPMGRGARGTNWKAMIEYQ